MAKSTPRFIKLPIRVYGTTGKPFLNKELKNLTEVLNQDVGGSNIYDDLMSYVQMWLVRKENPNNYVHPTQKPVSLHEKPLKRCSSPGDIIADFFGGSGSTLIACEQLKRTAIMMEKDPVFCDVIVARWEKLTGCIAGREEQTIEHAVSN
jgi:DNA modification methylase